MIDLKDIYQPSILLDDDPLIRALWEIAAKNMSIPLTIYASYESFISDLSTTPKNTIFYVDYHLRIDKNGIEICRDLHQQGFQNLILSSGESFKIEEYPFLKGIIGKKPPFI